MGFTYFILYQNIIPKGKIQKGGKHQFYLAPRFWKTGIWAYFRRFSKQNRKSVKQKEAD